MFQQIFIQKKKNVTKHANFLLGVFTYQQHYLSQPINNNFQRDQTTWPLKLDKFKFTKKIEMQNPIRMKNLLVNDYDSLTQFLTETRKNEKKKN